jgi:hypothetical protein
MQDILNTVRVIADMRNAKIEPVQRRLTVDGNPDQLALIGWLFTELDRPSTRPEHLRVLDNTFSDPRLSAVKILYPVNLSTALQMQELIMDIRLIAEVPLCVVLSGPGAIVIRGNAEQVALAEWIVAEIDQSMMGKPINVGVYHFPDSVLDIVDRRTTAVRIYYSSSGKTFQDLQEVSTCLRSIADVHRVVIVPASGAIIVRASTEQAELTDWLVDALNPRLSSGPRDYQYMDESVQSVVVPTDVDLAGLVTKVREATGMRRVVVIQSQRSIVMRGTPNELAIAGLLLR